MDHHGPNPLNENGLCLLSLDGGGVRGLSTLYILKDIMSQLNSERHDGTILKPCDIFDLIGGTSTGGLIAIMLGRLEMSVDDCIREYSQLMKSVFSEKVNNLPVDWSGNIKAQFDSNKLKATIEDVMARSGALPEDPMDNGAGRRCRTFVCTTAKETLQVVRLRSYDVQNEDAIAATICEAALATSAATRFFEPVTIGDRQFVDGAFGANNPIEEVEEEAADIWCPATRDLKPLVKCIVSVGTGNPGQAAMDDNILHFLSKTLVRMATKPESTERRFMARWSNEYRENRYFRFNVDHGLQDVRMTECHQQSLIESATHDYLHHPTQKTRIRDCILNLVSKEEKTDLEFDTTIREHSAWALRQRILKNATSANNNTWKQSHPHWLVPFERNYRFVDREFMSKIKQKLFTRARSQSMAIYGLGGVGKTQVALELAYQARDMFPDCSIFWIPAVDRETLEQAYQKIAKELRISLCGDEKEDVKALVQQRLSQPESGRWLLIYDNADDLDMWAGNTSQSTSSGLKDLLPRSDQGSIVFTTRSGKVAQQLSCANVIEVPEMDEKRATRVLHNSLVDKELLSDKESTQQLLKHLTYLPLAIVQAASFINENKMDMARYISLLRGQEQDAIDLLSEDFEDEGRYKSIRNPVATTWLTSFAQIQMKNTLAADILSFMACINHRDIPLSILPSAPQLQQEKAIGVLSSYSFIRVRHKDGRLEMHRLVHLAMRNWMRSVGTLQKCANSVMYQLWQHYPPFVTSDRTEWRAVVPHALQILKLTSNDEDTMEKAGLLWKVASCLTLDGRLNEAERHAHRSAEISKQLLGNEDSHTLSSLGLLAVIYEFQRHYFKALELHEEVYDVLKTAHGSDYPDTVRAIYRLAAAYYEAGNNIKAEELCSQAIKYWLRTVGPINYDTLTTMTLMSLIYVSQGRLHEAAEMASQSLKASRRIMGSDDPHTITSMTALATIHKDQWRLKEAEELQREALARSTSTMGIEHPHTLNIMGLLAHTLRFQHRDAEAIAMMTECTQLSEQIYGANHPHTMTAYYAWLDDWTKPRNVFIHFRDRYTFFQRNQMMRQRRKIYPRVKVCGGLYKAPRRVRDNSLMCEINKAVVNFPMDGVFPSDVTLIGIQKEKEKILS